MLDATGSIEAGLASARLNEAELAGKKLKTAALRKDGSAGAVPLDEAKGPGGGKDADGKLREACEGFEAVFLQKMWQDMRKSVPKEGFLHSKEEEQWLSMFDQEMAAKLAKDGGIGIKDMLYSQLKDRLQAASRELPSQVRDPLPIKSLEAAASQIRGLDGAMASAEGASDVQVEALPAAGAVQGLAQGPLKLAGADRQAPPAGLAAQAEALPGADIAAQVNALAARIEAEQSARQQRGPASASPIVRASLDRARRR
jgi:Rod binding domain-containing protein